MAEREGEQEKAARKGAEIEREIAPASRRIVKLAITPLFCPKPFGQADWLPWKALAEDQKDEERRQAGTAIQE